MTTIEWTDTTWNPVTGCTKVSQGCTACYAERMFPRVYAKTGRAFTDVACHPERLDAPLYWRKPRRVFVNSMSDLFHEDVPDSFIDEVFGVIVDADHHIYQILTKRPERMREYMQTRFGDGPGQLRPPSYVWLGVSVEDQTTADERIPPLLKTPAAVRFVSYEPALGPVDFAAICYTEDSGEGGAECRWNTLTAEHWIDNSSSADCYSNEADGVTKLDWVIVGGESGPKARPCDVEWIRSIVRQCRAANVPAFVKQLGANIRDRNDAGFDANSETWTEGPCAGQPTNPSAWPEPHFEVEHNPNGYREEYQGAPVRVRLRNRKGGDPAEWPLDLRVREWPKCPPP